MRPKVKRNGRDEALKSPVNLKYFVVYQVQLCFWTNPSAFDKFYEPCPISCLMSVQTLKHEKTMFSPWTDFSTSKNAHIYYYAVRACPNCLYSSPKCLIVGRLKEWITIKLGFKALQCLSCCTHVSRRSWVELGARVRCARSEGAPGEDRRSRCTRDPDAVPSCVTATRTKAYNVMYQQK